MGRALGCGARSRARKFEATTYLKTEHPEEIPALVRDLDAKARGLARGWEGLAVIEVRPTPSISSVAISLEVSSDLPSKAAQTARRFLDQVLDLMRDEGNIFKSASRELACA